MSDVDEDAARNTTENIFPMISERETTDGVLTQPTS